MYVHMCNMYVYMCICMHVCMYVCMYGTAQAQHRLDVQLKTCYKVGMVPFSTIP